jgi:hypothetical protein
MKTCGNCDLFRPSPYNQATGNGGCKAMEGWQAKYKERGTFPSDSALKAVYVELGGRFGDASALMHPRRDSKRCNRFKPKLIIVKNGIDR